MRRLLLILGTMIGIVAFTAVYVWVQPAPPQVSSRAHSAAATRQAAPAPPRPTTSDSVSPVGQGHDIYFIVPDEKTGTTAWKFRASRYEPLPDNSINVTNPDAEFYFSDGRIVSLKGTHGRVVVPGASSRGTDMRGPVTPPSRGELYDVTISLLHAENPGHAVLVCTVNNVSFDNDTFRIATEAYREADGTLVPADQVPVELRGDEYNFDGRGLEIRWNDRDRRLQKLEIAHGESLEVKSPTLLKGITPSTRPVEQAPARTATAVPQGPRAAAAPATAPSQRRTTPSAERELAAATTAPTTRKAATQPVYRASFEKDVVVLQGEKVVAQMDTLRIDFRQQAEEVSMASAPPAPRQAPRRPATAPRRRVTRTTTAPAAPVQQTGAAPQTEGNVESTIVEWSGPLQIIPLDAATAPRLGPGESAIEMLSAEGGPPVVLNYQDKEIHCASLLYNSAEDSLIVRNSPQVPVITMKDVSGSTFYTESLVYRGQDKKAVMKGASRAEVLIPDEQNKTAELLKVSWTESCELILASAGGEKAQPAAIERADLRGGVKLEHPRLQLTANSLQVDFDKLQPAPTTQGPAKQPPQPPIRQLTATGAVVCDMIDEQQHASRITANELRLITAKSATGQLHPRELLAIGDVHTHDDQQDLKAGRLRVVLAPTTRPGDQPKVESFEAQQQVEIAFKGGSASSSLLTATAEEDDYNILLTGSPSARIVSEDQSTLTGAIINVKPRRQVIEVQGAGTMKGAWAREGSGGEPTPFEASWERRLALQGLLNEAVITGNVVVKAVSSADDGVTRNRISGDEVAMSLMDAPSTTRPSTRAVAAAPATTRSSGIVDATFSDAFGSLRQKAVRTITVEGNTQIESVVHNPISDEILRRVHVYSPRVVMESEKKQFIIPTQGQMFVEDRSPTTQPTTQASTTAPATAPGTLAAAPATRPTTAPFAGPFGNMKGPTAFEWKERFIFDETTSRAQMSGDVRIVHGDDPRAQDHFQLFADRIIADVEQVKPSTTQPTTAESARKSSDPEIKVKMLTAEGNVLFKSLKAEFMAPMMGYDPITQTLSARGSEEAMVQVFEVGGATHVSFLAVTWNTRTWNVTAQRALGQLPK